MLIGIDTRPCSLSLRDRSMFNYEMTSNKSHLKMYLCKNQFLLIFSFQSIPIELWESTKAIFRQSAGFVSARGCLTSSLLFFHLLIEFFPSDFLKSRRVRKWCVSKRFLACDFFPHADVWLHLCLFFHLLIAFFLIDFFNPFIVHPSCFLVNKYSVTMFFLTNIGVRTLKMFFFFKNQFLFSNPIRGYGNQRLPFSGNQRGMFLKQRVFTCIVGCRYWVCWNIEQSDMRTYYWRCRRNLAAKSWISPEIN